MEGSATHHAVKREIDSASSTIYVLTRLVFGLVIAIAGATLLALSQQIGEIHFPFNVPGVLVTRVVSSLGSFMIVAGLYTNSIRPFFANFERARERNELLALFDSSLDRLANNVFRFGLTEIRTEMSFDALFDGLQHGDELWWLDTYAPNHTGWQTKLENALARGANVRMLVLDPSSAMGELRANELPKRFTPEVFHNELIVFLRDMTSIARESGRAGRMELRIYKDLLGCPIYMVRRGGTVQYVYSSMYLGVATGTGFPHLRWKPEMQDNDVTRYFVSYYSRKWDAATHVK